MPVHKSKIKNYIACAFILIFSGLAFYYLALRFISEIHCRQGEIYYNKKEYKQAVEHFEKAVKFQPGNALIYKNMGDAFYELAQKGSDIYLNLKNSREAYLVSVEKNPLDARVFYGLAVVEYRLERIYARQFPGVGYSPYNALPYFQEAVRLRPESISYNFGLLRYYAKNGHDDKILPIVKNLGVNYPQIYGYLKKETFWSLDLRSAYIQGLEQSIAKDINPRDAHTRISALMAEDENWEKAIEHYKKALLYKDFQNNYYNYIHLTSLYLKAGRFKKAEQNAVYALDMSPFKEKSLEQLYSIYKQQGFSEEFSSIVQQVREKFPFSSRFEILTARLLFDLKQYEEAKRICENLNKKKPGGPAYYWLYLIAQAQKDKDAMELAIQKATVFDSKNSHYHYLFSNLLKQLKKYESAENAADMAVKTQAKPSPHLFNHRAWIRWARHNYYGAIEDWSQAVRLSPNQAVYHAYIAQAYKKLDNKQLAELYYKKALKLDPDNAGYKKALQENKS
ncbi:Tetratricopeptide repeat-containing protein [Desulfonema limicola]|uniref:Tetratricopeptide repeat-containing protein n=1 Tax=Desulfonema limicola TaxID=45656 RepID=A0A975GFG6_9BACT|nr:tetratricopeptide repeat protein [Desulfonema limicola]QTA79242.1 Tetratricopeptide repeat-containing protein [Desulfonema limicola]